MRVVAFDPFVEPAAMTADGAEPIAFDSLLKIADFVSLHARASADNSHVRFAVPSMIGSFVE